METDRTLTDEHRIGRRVGRSAAAAIDPVQTMSTDLSMTDATSIEQTMNETTAASLAGLVDMTSTSEPTTTEASTVAATEPVLTVAVDQRAKANLYRRIYGQEVRFGLCGVNGALQLEKV